MVSSILVASNQKRAGKTTVCMGLVNLLGASYNRVGYFKPIGMFGTDPNAASDVDTDVHLMKDRCNLAFSVRQMTAVSAHQLRGAMVHGKFEQLLDDIIAAYKHLASQCDFIVCEGINFTGPMAPFEFDINVELSRNLGAPMLLVVNATHVPACDCAAAPEQRIVTSVTATARQLSLKSCDLMGVVLNEAETDLSGRIQSALAADFNQLGISILGAVQKLPDALNSPASQVAKGLDAQRITSKSKFKPSRTTPRQFLSSIMDIARANKQRIVLPEGAEPRILKAAHELMRLEVAQLTLLGDEGKIAAQIDELGLKFASPIDIINPLTSEHREPFARRYMELRAKKNPTYEKSFELMGDPTYFGTMLVKQGLAAGMVSGSITTTAATLRPSLEFVKTKPGYAIASSVFFMCLHNQVLVFGDCAVNPNPSAEQLADIALSSAETAQSFGIEPRVAMLSYATGGSGTGQDVEMVVQATSIVRERKPDLKVEGPIQYDAAIDPVVAKTKLPESAVAGHATVYVFPNLTAGNIAYKAVQRASGATAVGPLMQGMQKPVNDLSRGCTVEDIINTVAMTAIQAQRNT